MNIKEVSPVRFLHIPKCGGTTFNHVLSREYRSGRDFSFTGNAKTDRERFDAFRKQGSGSFDLIRGHAPILTEIPEVDDVATITMFRDPIRRVKSFCQHVSEGKSPHLLDRFPRSSFDLDAFLESGLGELSNLQTKMMINSASCDDATEIDALGVARSVDLAMRNLDERIAIFGLVERYDETLIQFAERLGWSLPVYAKRNTRNEQRLLVFEPRHLDKIQELNLADCMLYEKVTALYAERYPLSQAQAKQLKKQQFINKHIMPVLDALRPRNIIRLFRVG